MNQHPDVAESAALAVPSEYSEDEVKVCIVLADGAKVTHEELIEFLMPRMPKFMVPRYVEFVTELPKTEGTMRTRKFELRNAALSDATWDREAAGIRVDRGGVAMATAYETILVDFDRGVTTITLNRPEQRNAINLAMEQELDAAI